MTALPAFTNEAVGGRYRLALPVQEPALPPPAVRQVQLPAAPENPLPPAPVEAPIPGASDARD